MVKTSDSMEEAWNYKMIGQSPDIVIGDSYSTGTNG
jgi:hypothetical protein